MTAAARESRSRVGRRRETYPADQRRLFFEEWPRLDQMAWRAACAVTSPLDVPPPLANVAADTRKLMEASWGHYLQILALNNDLEPDLPPASRPTRDRLTHHIQIRRRTLAPYSMYQELLRIELCMNAMAPGIDWSWIRKHPAAPRHREIRSSRTEKLTFDPAAMALHCYESMDQADSLPRGAANSVVFRDGLLGLLLCRLPIRRTNLGGLRLGRHVRPVTDGFRITIAAEETKNFIPIDDLLTGQTAAQLARYLEVHRRVLMNGRESDALWIGIGGRPLKDGALNRVFRDLGIAAVGEPVSPHSFRRSHVTAILAHDPSDLDAVRDTMPHKSIHTTNRYYDLSGRSAAQGIFEALIRDICANPPDEDA